MHFYTKNISNPIGTKDKHSARCVQKGAKRCTKYFRKTLKNKGKRFLMNFN